MADAHNIFLSWSRPQAKAAALALRGWLPRVIQASRPWMSEMDIEKGKPWFDELMGALGGLKLGIVCLTPECLSEPWVLFEVGVICRALDHETRIWTYLLSGLRHSDVPNPLGIFQHTVATKDDTFRLLESVNQAMGERAIPEEILKDQFDLRWKELDEKLRALPVTKEPVPKARSSEEMFGEIVEAVRAGASGGTAMEETLRELRQLRRLLEGLAVDQVRVPLSAFSGIGARMPQSAGSGLPAYDVVSGVDRPLSIKERMQAAQEALPELKEALEQAERELAAGRARVMRLNRELQKEKRVQKGSDTAKKGDDEKK